MHIAKTETGKFVIRKFSLSGWRVANFNLLDDGSINYWWPKDYKHRWTFFDTEDQALEAVIRHKLAEKKRDKMRFVRWI